MMLSAATPSGGTGVDGVQAGRGTRACAVSTVACGADAAREAECLAQENAPAIWTRVGGGDSGSSDVPVRAGITSVDLVGMPSLPSFPHLPMGSWTCGTGRSASVKGSEAASLREGGVVVAEHDVEECCGQAAAGAAPSSAPLLTSVEEQPPRGLASGIPAVVLLRHRMGCSTVVLRPHQRKSFSRHDLENFVLYKEQKYDAVNVLWRFCILMLLVLSSSVFCLVLSTCTAEWLSVQSDDAILSVGLFFSCQGQHRRTCTSWGSAQLEWTVVNAATGATLCHASADFVHRFIVTLWAMGILQLLCEVVALLLGLRIAARPTRSGALVLLVFDLLLSVGSGIATAVLFSFYTSCLRRTCEGEHAAGNVCSVHYRYGYQLYIATVAVHGLLLVLALCMHSHIHSIRVRSRRQLRAERHRLSRDVHAKDYVARTLGLPTTASFTGDGGDGGCARRTCNAAGTASPLNGRRSARQRRGAVEAPSSSRMLVDQDGTGDEGVKGDVLRPGYSRTLCTTSFALDASFAGSVNFSGEAEHCSSSCDEDYGMAAMPAKPARSAPLLQHGEPLIFFAEVPDDVTDERGSELLSGRRSRCHRDHQPVTTFSSGDGRTSTAAASTAAVPYTLERDTESPPEARNLSVDAVVAVGSDNDQCQRCGGEEAPPGCSFLPRTGRQRCAGPQTAKAQPSLTSRKLKQILPGKLRTALAYPQGRKRHGTFLRFFNREFDADYLTAAELGVPIAGATDWVYDDRSDMYYSFDRNMFWDPLTQEYYSCALKSWQESPDQVVEVRDVLDFVLRSLPSSRSGTPLHDERIEDALLLRHSPTSVSTGDGDDANVSGVIV
ncbi:hypothetical protein GH5_04688 [Leishmania sp. Ghana 2012 LV757]|uniref:hypothetical protein n=1 Tax=Leishmania sp. Ghana 2012 LV757 TaxID=2803181 RepID=UPI001B4B35FE|nr:hypothetical protein GH5_04688 [Leishmania sp. Ghana 2012 LV757]